jgi:hypothetical protein
MPTPTLSSRRLRSREKIGFELDRVQEITRKEEAEFAAIMSTKQVDRLKAIELWKETNAVRRVVLPGCRRRRSLSD